MLKHISYLNHMLDIHWLTACRLPLVIILKTKNLLVGDKILGFMRKMCYVNLSVVLVALSFWKKNIGFLVMNL